MLEVQEDLPNGAVLGAARADLRDAIAGTSAFWLEGQEDRFTLGPEDAITGWNADARHAEPSEPNTGNGRLTRVGARVGLRCKAEVNCGLVVRGATENAARFTMAVVYQPSDGAEARTLLTVNTGFGGGDAKTANYLFLSDGGAFLTVKDTRGAIEMTAPVVSGGSGPRMLIVTLSGDQLAVAENLAPAVTVQGADPGMRCRGDLFIGCRSDRRGLKKTLGDSVVLDVMFWPDHTLLLPRCDADAALDLALRRYFLWEY
ncbi:MAG: hypothetical protein JXJ18_09420 [Rhodobacteraceae bacterium]|nr:hypothetical protein [Paracoccaceae bacterium]